MLAKRTFSTTRTASSYIGSTPISIPKEVSVLSNPASSLSSPGSVQVTGPNGSLTVNVPPYMKITSSDQSIEIKVENAKVKEQRSMWGTTRAILANHVKGVSEGFQIPLKFVGVGYRAAVEGDKVILRVGYSKPVELKIPEGIQATCPQPTALFLMSANKELVTGFAASIRSWRKPEPYKGKGILVNGETIKLKNAKGKK